MIKYKIPLWNLGWNLVFDPITRMYSIRDSFIRTIVSILTSSRDRLVYKSVTINLAQDSVLSQNDSAYMVPTFVNTIVGK